MAVVSFASVVGMLSDKGISSDGELVFLPQPTNSNPMDATSIMVFFIFFLCDRLGYMQGRYRLTCGANIHKKMNILCFSRNKMQIHWFLQFVEWRIKKKVDKSSVVHLLTKKSPPIVTSGLQCDDGAAYGTHLHHPGGDIANNVKLLPTEGLQSGPGRGTAFDDEVSGEVALAKAAHGFCHGVA